MKLHERSPLAPPETPHVRYQWLPDGEPLDNKAVIVEEDHHKYWRVVRITTGDALMCGFSFKWSAEGWAKSNGYRVLQPISS